MAIRRAKQKAQVIEKLTAVAPPGETFLACVHCETGPSPWLNALFDEVPLLGLIVALTRRFYFLTLTNTSVVVNSANRFTNRPGEIVAAFRREDVPISRVKRGRVWSRLYFHFPGDAKPRRLNVHRYWRREFDQLVAALPQRAADPGEAAGAAAAPEDPGQASATTG
jgi:hypothetical protein